jgi:hypothetical protein
MTADEFLASLELPAAARVQQRIPKKLLLENGAPTAADKRAISDGVGEIQWLFALKPGNVGIPSYSDETREYLEIAVLRITFREGAKANRLNELIHRAIPYPLVLLATLGSETTVSLAHKRWAQNEAGKVVLDGELTAASLADVDQNIRPALEQALPLSRQPSTSMFALYQSWIDVVLALLSSNRTGTFRVLDSEQAKQRRRQGLALLGTIDARMRDLQAAGAKASQMARQVEINLQLQQLRRQRDAATDDLQGKP